VSFNGRERIVSEGVSGCSGRCGRSAVHLFLARSHARGTGGGEWVPAVLRYNRIPNRVLLRIANSRTSTTARS
jgi:hypothetical protein